MMTDLSRIREALDTYIRPQTFPVGIKLVKSADEIPAKARRPKRDVGRCMAMCQGVALARRHGWVIAMGEEEMLCPIGAVALGFLAAKEEFLKGIFPVPFWVKNQDIRAKMAHSIPKLEVGKYSHVVASPLNKADFEPNVIVVYWRSGSSCQARSGRNLWFRGSHHIKHGGRLCLRTGDHRPALE